MSPLDVDVVVVMDHARSTLVQAWDLLSVAAATKIASYQTRAISSKIIQTYPIKDVHPPKVVLQALSSGVASVASLKQFWIRVQCSQSACPIC